MWSQGYGRAVGSFEGGHVFLERNIQKLADFLHRLRWLGNKVFVIDLVHGTALHFENVARLPQVLVSQQDSFRETGLAKKPVRSGRRGNTFQNGIQVTPKENKICVRKLFGH
jgi:hypothetical protein